VLSPSPAPLSLPFTHAGILSVTTGAALQGGGNIAPTSTISSSSACVVGDKKTRSLWPGGFTFTVIAPQTKAEILVSFTTMVEGASVTTVTDIDYDYDPRPRRRRDE
jgi:hypothetical protein